MKLTHTRDNGLTALLVGTNGECWVLFSELSKTIVELGDISLRLRLYSDRDYSVRECHRLEHNRMILVTEGITCADIFETYARTYVACCDNFNGVLLVGVHLEETAYALFLARTWVEYV